MKLLLQVPITTKKETDPPENTAWHLIGKSLCSSNSQFLLFPDFKKLPYNFLGEI